MIVGYGPFLGSGPNRGRIPVEWGEILSIHTSIRPSWAPLEGPQTPLTDPHAPLAGRKAPLAGPQAPLARPQAL